jgi:hypothetical protein
MPRITICNATCSPGKFFTTRFEIRSLRKPFAQTIGTIHFFFEFRSVSISSCSFLQRWSAECARSGYRAGGSVQQQHQFIDTRQSQPAGVARYDAARTVKACGNSLKFEPVLGIRIRRVRMILCLPDPDPLVRGMDPDPSLFS